MSITREQALDLDRNPNWKLMVSELDQLISMESEKLLHAPADECIRLQERIKALRLCTRFPQLLADREEDSEPSLIT